jgi:cyclopropane-fatty-acyl-phospholipid synthase
MHPVRERIEGLLGSADVRVGGARPWDMHVHDRRLAARLLAGGSLALGDAYMDGWWDAPSLDGLLSRLLANGIDQRAPGLADARDAILARLVNLQSRRRSRTVGERHYDLGNAFYREMLGRWMVYSCGYWRGRDGMPLDDLDAAQEAKLDLVCRKLRLQPGMRVLDIGCGWGEALKYAAERHGVSGVGVTISAEQADFARALCAGLPVDIRLQDYRDLRGERFDCVFSIGMFEHVGLRNYRDYFELVRAVLPRDGLFLLHSIGGNVSRRRTDPWIARHIFPNSLLPSARQIAEACEGLMVIEDWHGFGADYDRTLQAWHANIEAGWERLPPRYDERFRRMWRYYLAAAMASFRTRRIQLWQVLLSPDGVPGGIVVPR